MILGRLRQWLRVVPLADYFVVVVLGLEAVMLCIAIILSQFDDPAAWGEFFGASAMMIWLATIVYAGIRLSVHPLENRPYGTWLADSPWQYPQALPLGPLHLVWQDVFVVGLLTALFPAQLSLRLSVPTLFLLVYCLANAYSQSRVRIYWTGYIVLSLLGCAILAFPFAWLCFALVYLMYPVVCWGTRQLLRRFPYRLDERKRLKLVPE